MARKGNAPRSVSVAQDIPRLGFTCGSYQAGHNVHYIPALKIAPDLEPVRARVSIGEGDTLMLEVGGERLQIFQHNVAGVELLIDKLGSACEWFSGLHMARWIAGGQHVWANFAPEPIAPCVSREAIQVAEADTWT